MPLCEAYLEVTSDPVRATARTKENLWETVHKLWAEIVLKKGPMRVDRLPSALEKQLKRIRAWLSTFTSHYLAVKAMPTTGNLSEEDIISSAVARYFSLDVYDDIRADRDQDKRNDKTRKRKAKVAHTESGLRVGAYCGRVASSAAPPTAATPLQTTFLATRRRTTTRVAAAAAAAAADATAAFRVDLLASKLPKSSEKTTSRWTLKSRTVLRPSAR